MPPASNVEQLRNLLGGLSYYPKCSKNLYHRSPLNAAANKALASRWPRSWSKSSCASWISSALVPSPSSRPIRGRGHLPAYALVLPCLLRRVWSISGAQEQPDSSLCPVVYVSRTALPAERVWSVSDLEAGRIVRAIKRLGEPFIDQLRQLLGSQSTRADRQSRRT